MRLPSITRAPRRGVGGGDFILLRFTAETRKYYGNFEIEEFEID
jgi:hypothetical protein